MSEPTVIDVNPDVLFYFAIFAILGIYLLTHREELLEWCSDTFKKDPGKIANMLTFGSLGLAVTFIPALLSTLLHIVWIRDLSYAIFIAVIIGLRIYGSRK